MPIRRDSRPPTDRNPMDVTLFSSAAKDCQIWSKDETRIGHPQNQTTPPSLFHQDKVVENTNPQRLPQPF